MFCRSSLRTVTVVVALMSALATGCSSNSSDTTPRPTALPQVSVMPTPEVPAVPATPTTSVENKINLCKTITASRLNELLPSEGGYDSGYLMETGEYVIGADPTYAPAGCDFKPLLHGSKVFLSVRVGKQSLCDGRQCPNDRTDKLFRQTAFTDFQAMARHALVVDSNTEELPLNTLQERSVEGADYASLSLKKLSIEDGYCLNCTGVVAVHYFFVTKGVNYLVTVHATSATPRQVLDIMHTVTHSAAIAEGTGQAS